MPAWIQTLEKKILRLYYIKRYGIENSLLHGKIKGKRARGMQTKIHDERMH